MQRLPRFDVVTPARIEDVIAALATPGARLIAGGTDLLPHLKHRLDAPPLLVSLARLRLDHVEGGDDALRIGAGVRLADLAAHPQVRARLPSLARAAGLVASPSIRNLATLGGNLHAAPRCRYLDQTPAWRAVIGGCLRSGGDRCHVVDGGRRCVAAMSSDCAPVLVSLDGVAVLAGPRGPRAVALADYYRADGAAPVARAADELLTEIRVPTPPIPRRATYAKWTVRGAIDFPLISIAMRFDLAADTVDAPITGASVVVGALAVAPRRLTTDALVGLPLAAPATADVLAHLVAAQCRPLPNLPYDPAYRRRVLPVHARRALAALVLAGAVVAGCAVEPAPTPLPDGDLASFAADVQPILDHRCADPGCHGRADRALSIYSTGRFRSDPARRFLIEPISADELAANVRGVVAFTLDVDEVDDVLVVRKPLAAEQGGCWHAGGAIFATLEDRDLRTLRDWLTPLFAGGGEP